MNKKIVGILVCALLIAVPVMSIAGSIKIEKINNYKNNFEPLSQPPIQWEKTYGYPNTGFGHFVQQTSDGGYIATGVIYIGGIDAEVFLVKTDANGNTAWSQTYGGASTFDCGYCVQQTTDGGYVIAGCYHGYGLWLIKTDSSGNQQWNQIFSGPMFDTAYCVQQTTDGGYVIVGGYTYAPGPPDMWIIKTDSGGNQQWDTKVGGPSAEYGHCIRQTSDGGYIVVGYTDSYGAGQEDAELVKLDSAGTIVWIQYYGGNLDERGNSVRQTSDGGYIFTGFTKSFGAGQADVYLVKTDSLGNVVWSQTYGGANDDEGNSVRQTTDGGYIIAGNTQSYGSGGVDIYSIKTDSTGVKLWDDTYGGTGIEDGQCVQQTSDGYYIIAGTKFTTYSEFWLIKLGVASNQPPNKPAKPSGPPRGNVGTSYTYSTSTTDPDTDNVYYWFDWGDGNNSGWVGPYASGAVGNASYIWASQGTYAIKVKAKDDPYGQESAFSDPLTVIMPRNRAINKPFLNLLKQYSNLFELFQWLLLRLEA